MNTTNVLAPTFAIADCLANRGPLLTARQPTPVSETNKGVARTCLHHNTPLKAPTTTQNTFMRHRFKHYARHQRNFYYQANPPPHAYTTNQRSHHQRRHAIQSCVPPYSASAPTLQQHAHATNATTTPKLSHLNVPSQCTTTHDSLHHTHATNPTTTLEPLHHYASSHHSLMSTSQCRTLATKLNLLRHSRSSSNTTPPRASSPHAYSQLDTPLACF
ncbi:hypothetical protein Pmani_011699 [Petrolisthes manimaculis]|uniref:Uncharacterized protein n=1 Tax=Petrolisthes manimaculis TaxID=1843537 RepID=A0AAE1Q0N3_9EUCA|nr:hypothetical protein Pmani_011699 [Petrolisthes manimaculis]